MSILAFISNFRNFTDKDTQITQFSKGYCWHFAKLLEATFPGGTVCWCAPYAHFIYLYNNHAYDINGLYDGEADYFIPETYLGPLLTDFTHVPNKAANATKDQINDIITRFESERTIK